MKAIVGLDLSLRATGVCVWGDRAIGEPGTLLVSPKKTEGVERLDEIREQVLEACAGALLVVVEDFAFSKNMAMAREVTGLGWLVRWQLWRAQIPYVTLGPMQLKKFVTGVGKADKNVMLKEVWKRWGFDTNDDNLADAYALAKFGRTLLGLEHATAEFQREVVADVQVKNAALLMRVVKGAKAA